MAQEIRFSAPALPIPPAEYSSMTQQQHNNLLRLYFNQIDQALRELAVAAPQDFYSEVAKGNIKGHTIIHKFCANFDIDVGTTPQTIWSQSGLYPWSALATPQTLYCLSTSASDTSDLIIEGLGTDYAPLTETVTLTGTTAVATTNQFLRVYRCRYDAGNVGEITLRTVSAVGTVVAEIRVGYGSTLMGVYTIPAGYTGYLVAMDITASSSKDAQIGIYQRNEGGAFRIVHIADVFDKTYRYDFSIPLRFTAKTDIDLRAIEVYSDDTRLTSNFDILLVDDAFLGQPIDIYG